MNNLLSKFWFKCVLIVLFLTALLFASAGLTVVAALVADDAFVGRAAEMIGELEQQMDTNGLSRTLGTIGIWWIMHRGLLVLLTVLSVLAALASFICLLCSMGHKEGVDGIWLCWLHRIPLDLLAAWTVLLCVFWSWLVFGVFDGLDWFIVSFGVTLLAAFVLPFVLSFAARAKAPGLFRNTVIWKLLSWIGRGLSNLGLVWKTALLFGAASLADLIAWAVTHWDADGFIGWFLVTRFLAGVVLLYITGALKRLQALGRAIAEGGTAEAIRPVPRWLPHLYRHGENLSSIQLGMHRAVEEQMRAERMKTELITNVSHDIKTPLTSIVNYVDLLKKEDIQPEKAREYVAVLDRQSDRLRKLTEDLVEASRASAGAVTIHPTRIDVNVLISQIAGEYVDRLDGAQLETVFKPDPSRPQIMADERHLGRVIDNLLSNICKYAQPGTRVYFESAVEDGQAVMRFKNVSRYELDIPADELMARFVRGDRSRHSEGSGLGLSIAQSLTELQGGQFRLEIDGDLFKATLRFPCAPDNAFQQEEPA